MRRKNAEPDRIRFIRLAEVTKITALGKDVIFDKMECGLFPQAIEIAARTIAWVESEIYAYNAAVAKSAPRVKIDPRYRVKTRKQIPVLTESQVPHIDYLPKSSRELKIDSEIKCGVYFLIRGEIVVYAGSSENVVERVGEHYESKTFDRVMWMPVNRDHLRTVEGKWILRLKPTLNGWVTRTGLRLYCAPQPGHRYHGGAAKRAPIAPPERISNAQEPQSPRACQEGAP